MDYLAVASIFGSPVGYVVVGFALDKVYNKIASTEKYAKRANHNSDTILRAMIKRNLIDADEIKEIEMSE